MLKINPSDQSAIDVLDANGIRTGEILTRKEIHERGKYHRAVHLYLFDRSYNLLLQQRSMNVDHCPGMYSISLTGHLDAGESSIVALQREIQEELGLDPSKMDIQFLFSYKQSMTINPTYIDRQFNDVYVSYHNFDIQSISFEKAFITEIKWVSIKEIFALLANKESDFAKIYGRECADVFYFLKGRLGCS